MITKKELKEGWGFSYGKYHYFRNAMSLCRRVGFYRGELELDGISSMAKKPLNNDCKTCFKKRLKELGKVSKK